MLSAVGFLRVSLDVIMPKQKRNHRPKLDQTMVRLQDDAAKQLIRNGSYPSPNHPEEQHFSPGGKSVAFHAHYCLNVMKAVVI